MRASRATVEALRPGDRVVGRRLGSVATVAAVRPEGPIVVVVFHEEPPAVVRRGAAFRRLGEAEEDRG